MEHEGPSSIEPSSVDILQEGWPYPNLATTRQMLVLSVLSGSLLKVNQYASVIPPCSWGQGAHTQPFSFPLVHSPLSQTCSFQPPECRHVEFGHLFEAHSGEFETVDALYTHSIFIPGLVTNLSQYQHGITPSDCSTTLPRHYGLGPHDD